MAGSFLDQYALSTNNDFLAKVRCAMIFRATEVWNNSQKFSYSTLEQAKIILTDRSSGMFEMIARYVASGNATIAAAAPAMPSDGDVQFAVNTMLSSLLNNDR